MNITTRRFSRTSAEAFPVDAACAIERYQSAGAWLSDYVLWPAACLLGCGVLGFLVYWSI